MPNGGMDEFDWLQSFLPADSQPDHEPNSNNEAYHAHPAFHDTEVAKAAVMHQQALRSYSFMRSNNPGTNHALNPSQVYSQALDGQYRGNQHQANSDTQFNNPHSGPSAYPTHRSHNISQRSGPSVPSQHHLTAQVYQDAYRHGQTGMDSAGPSQRPLDSMSTPLETTEDQRTHTPAALQSRFYVHSTAPAQNTQQLSVSNAVQRRWPVPSVQRTHQPVAGPQASQSAYQIGLSTPLVSPKGYNTSAARSTLDPRQSITPTTSIREASNPQIQNPATNFARSNQVPPRPSSQNYDHVQAAVPTAPNRVHSPATSQPVSSRSPSVSFVSSAPASSSAPPAPPAQTTTVPRHLDNGWSQEQGGTQGEAAPTSSYQSPNQTSQQPPISQSNEQRLAGSPAFASSTPPAAFHRGPSSYSSYTSGPRRGTFSQLAGAKQPAAGNPQLRVYPLPGPLHHQTKRWVPTQENSSSYMPPAKKPRLDNVQGPMTTQKDTSAGIPAPGARVYVEYARHRGPGKFLKNRDDLVQPIRPSDALPKHTYDPTTIARDVLIAAGKHPTEKVLNHHLEALRRNFTKIDYLADLATFRWDLVDVKQPEPQVDHMPPAPAPQTLLRPPPHPQPPQAQQSLSRDPNITTNHVTARDYAPVPSRDTPPNRQVAMPTRIETRAPGGLSAWGTLPFKPPTYHSFQPIVSSKLPSPLPRVDPASDPPQTSSHQSVPFTISPSQPPNPNPNSDDNPPRIVQKVRSQSDSSRTMKPPEARGLPQPQVVIPPSPHKMPQKKRPGRSHKSAAGHVEVAIPREQPVDYQIFPCKWEGCAAELHNIDSVRAHVIKVHIPHSLVCKWKDCGNKTPMAAADMFTHVSSEHISKMAWQLGDGPKVPVTAENKPNYPSVLGDRSARKGTMVLPVDECQVKAFSKAHGKLSEKTKAQALLEAGRHWKQQVGPEMDWSDRRLSTPARQGKIHCGEVAFVGEN
ncbi:hypothetical protein N7472_006004 [Penicillium cf. griseofulvum]|uniref:C2H2-type domain-containing protein n=1 Tax=Penicillium cf. griseofulvum TaxID=2972120 RepID=A0A9W9MGD3_9EURO|nr:hypothetical protein N7472_006004 [Penicillium cf. griseofulvum]